VELKALEKVSTKKSTLGGGSLSPITSKIKDPKKKTNDRGRKGKEEILTKNERIIKRNPPLHSPQPILTKKKRREQGGGGPFPKLKNHTDKKEREPSLGPLTSGRRTKTCKSFFKILKNRDKPLGPSK